MHLKDSKEVFCVTRAPHSTRSRYVWHLLYIVNTDIPQMWNGSFFSDVTLTATGLVVQLGHDDGDTCPTPSSLHDLMVFDLSGVHRLVICYCCCDGVLFKDEQLLDECWFPATVDRPTTAFTFDILDFFHKLQDRNKCNPYDFYHAIIQRSDAAGLNPNIVYIFLILSAIILLTDSSVPL